MTHTTIDYSKSPAPKFDAIQDIKEYLGVKRWLALYPLMKQVTSPLQFQTYCQFAGIQGLPIIAWYDHYHGEGAYDRNWDGEDGQ